MNRYTAGSAILVCAGVLAMGATGLEAQNCNGMSGMSNQGMSSTMGQDKAFVTEASQGDYTEITFSQLALKKSNNPKVKAFARKMIGDHNQLEVAMKPQADKLGVTPATALDAQHQQQYDQLNQLSGAAFDKQYMSDMDADHHKVLEAFKQEESTTQDAKLKPIVAKGEKVVAHHTEMADKLSNSLGGTSSGM